MKLFPLWALLQLYHTAHPKDVYVGYGEGLKLLVDWLGPIEIQEESTKLPSCIHIRDSWLINKYVGASDASQYWAIMNKCDTDKFFK